MKDRKDIAARGMLENIRKMRKKYAFERIISELCTDSER